jgi:hypothetical protein
MSKTFDKNALSQADNNDARSALSLFARILSIRSISDVKQLLYDKGVPQDVVSSNEVLEVLINCILYLTSMYIANDIYLLFFRGGNKLVLDLFYAPDKRAALKNYILFIKSLSLVGVATPELIVEILNTMGLPDWIKSQITIQSIDAIISIPLYVKTGTENDNKLYLDQFNKYIDPVTDKLLIEFSKPDTRNALASVLNWQRYN